MIYQKYTPDTILRPYIECYFRWQGHVGTEPVIVDSPPTAYTAMVFNLASPTATIDKNNSLITTPRSFIAGQAISNYKLVVKDKIDQFGLVFKPTGLFKLLKVPMYELVNSRIDVEDICGAAYHELYDRLLIAPNDLTRVHFVEQFLIKRAELQLQNGPDQLDKSSSTMLLKYGNVNISQLLDDIYMSRRKFERHFFRQVGLSPKFFCRIRRYGFICSLMAGHRKVDWANILYKAGYYDQSHFIRDFREFAGTVPTKYLAKNQELMHYLEDTSVAHVS